MQAMLTHLLVVEDHGAVEKSIIAPQITVFLRKKINIPDSGTSHYHKITHHDLHNSSICHNYVISGVKCTNRNKILL